MMFKKLSVVLACLLLFSVTPVMAQNYCEGDFDSDGDQDGSDASLFKSDFGRSGFQNPCPTVTTTTTVPCGCPYEMVDCGDKCVDPMTDKDYCGANSECLGGTVCGTGYVCVSGTCTLSCLPNLTNCSGTCVDTDTDESNCGSCDNVCSSGQMCVNGECELPPETCSGTLSPLGRWCDQNNGTVKDMTSGLVWLKDAGWGSQTLWADCSGDFVDAHTRAGTLYDGMAGEPVGLSDGSVEGDWRLPTKSELVRLMSPLSSEYIYYGQTYFFTNVMYDYYWSSSTYASDIDSAWRVHMYYAHTWQPYNKGNHFGGRVWPVRGGH